MGADIYYLRPGQTAPEKRQFSSARSDQSIGYFHDPYDANSTLGLFGVGLFQDGSAFVNADHETTSEYARMLLEVLEESTHIFEANVAELSREEEVFQREEAKIFLSLLDTVRRTKGARLFWSI